MGFFIPSLKFGAYFMLTPHLNCHVSSAQGPPVRTQWTHSQVNLSRLSEVPVLRTSNTLSHQIFLIVPRAGEGIITTQVCQGRNLMTRKGSESATWPPYM